MSDCGVCLSSGEGSSIGYRCVIVHAGKDWKCEECGSPILKGSLYELASGFNAEDCNAHWQMKTCLICAEIANAFSCGGDRFHGTLWNSFEDVFPKLTTACFMKLQTPEAKAELQHRWMRWKGLLK